MITHTIAVLVENHHGALARIAGLFAGRGYNIISLTVAETDDATVSRMTIVVENDTDILEQIVKQLNRLIDVIKVIDFGEDPVIDREIVLVRIDASRSNRHEIIELASIFGATVAAVAPSSLTVELTSESRRADEFISLVKPYGIKELVRSGRVAIAQSRK